jgi:hypothetical protein
MSLSSAIPNHIVKRKFITLLFITASLAAFATLGDGKSKKFKPSGNKNTLSSKNFSLRTGYDYKSNKLFTMEPEKKFIMLNSVATYQKGNSTFVLPLKKKVFLDKVKFNPASN